MSRKRVALALLLMGLGLFFLLDTFGVSLPDWESMWPVLVIAGGIYMLLDQFFGSGRDPGRVFVGTAAVLVGAVFAAITLGPFTYQDLDTWWPVFLIILGVAFLARWIAGGARRGNALFLGVVALLVGGVAGAINLRLLGPQTQDLLPTLWPALLIAAGLLVLLQGLFSRRS
jgi:hypothetical protein